MPLPSTDLAFYALLLASGILGNALVLMTVISNALDNKVMPASDLILSHLTVVLLLLSILRNVLVVTFQNGVVILFSRILWKVFMFGWTLLRSMSVWGTLSISVFHYISIKNYYGNLRRNIFWTSEVLAIMWIFNCLFFIPAFLYTDRMGANATFSVQLIGTSTKPVLGCVWDFPTPYTNLVFVTSSLVIHEVIPIILMVVTNISSLYTLQRHSKTIAAQKTIKRVASERKAALVILTLVLLFVLCWGSNVVATNFYNFTKGSLSTSFLLTIANFGAYIFVGFGPLVLLIGHSKLRRKLVHLLCRQWKRQVDPTGNSPKNNGNASTVNV
ncbi:LOW QUALITY PROTEIN: olfactory receptor class A-like protein 4 [Ranitomeya imitator]|uniref:LOW QUALITY PROTEIN: olfactory receptor class A-like protein 4 n=1 Tax=Ranitomeya imitator TaxID=111125 RepID=UPI0037E6FF6A